MKVRLQENYKKIISYVIAVVAVVSVLFTGITVIREVQNTDLRSYHVHGRYVSCYGPLEVTNQDSFIYEFVCVGEETVALLIEAQLYDDSIGEVLYRIEDVDGNKIIDGWLGVQEARMPGYDGIWIDVSDLGLEQGETYRLSALFGWTGKVIYIYEDFKISVTQIFEYNYAAFYTVISIILILLAFVWLYFIYKKGFGTKLYVITSLVMGIFIVFLMPPANRDDEYRHFLRAYMEAEELQVEFTVPTGTESGLIGDSPEGQYLLEVPYEINELRLMGYEDNYNGNDYKTEINDFLCIDKLMSILKTETKDSTHYVSLAGVMFKNKISYWPQILSMKLVDLMGARDLFLYYAARLGQLLVCVFMEALAMKLAPRMKEMVWLLAFIPNAFILKASCNPDGLMTAEILLLAAIVIWMKEQKIDVLSKKGIMACLLYLVLSYNIMLMKFPYILISLGLLVYLQKDNVLLAREWMKAHKKQTIGIAGAILALGIFVVVFAKNILLTFVYSFLPQTHITYMLAHPGEVFQLFIEKWGFMCVNLLSGMNGEFFIPYALFVFAILIMTKKQLSAKKRIWFGVLFGILIMVIVLAGYSLSPADHGAIEEIGYRYLLPFLVVGAVALPSGNEKTEKYARQLMPFAIFVTMTTTMLTWIVGWSV